MDTSAPVTLLLSARTQEQLWRSRRQLASFLEARPGIDLQDVATTLVLGRERFACRCAVVGDRPDGLIAALRGDAPAVVGTASAQPPRLALVFAADPGDADALVDALPEVRRRVDRIVHPTYETAAVSRAVAVGFGLAVQLAAAGVAPVAACGDGPGVLAAAAFAGAMDFSDAVAVAATLDRAIDETLPLAAAVVDTASDALGRRADVAAVAAFGATRCLVAGERDAVEALAVRRLIDRTPTLPRSLRPDGAARVAEALADVALAPPSLPLAGAPAGDIRAWLLEHLVGCAPTGASLAAAAERADLLVELSTRPALVAVAQDHVGPARALCLPGGGAPGESWPLALAELWCRGLEPDVGAAGRRIRLPLYPFRRPAGEPEPELEARAQRQALAAAWAAVLGTAPEPGVSFRTAGGSSLQLLELCERLRRIQPALPPFADLAEADSFDELAAILEDAATRAADGTGAGDDVRVLTSHQQRTLFLDLARSGRRALVPENTVVAAHELHEHIDSAALADAFAALQREHDVLRMIVSWNGTRWVSRTSDEPLLPFSIRDLPGDDPAALERARAALADEAFEPVEQPLGRGVLLTQGSRAIVSLVLHRAVTMPASADALLARLLLLYEAAVTAR